MADRPADRHARHEGRRVAFVAERLRDAGVDVLVADAGTGGPPHGIEPDITREELAAEVGADARRADRPRRGRRRRWPTRPPRWRGGCTPRGGSTACSAAGGSGNTAIATAAMRALPVGVPKLMVSTMAAGDTRDYIGGSDVTLMASVTDVAGLNSISARILANAAAAMAGHGAGARAGRARRAAPADRRDDVRRHHAVRDPRARGAGGARLRGARVPRHRHRRPRDGGAGRRGLPGRRAGRDDDRAVRRPRRRRALGRARTGSRRPGAPGSRRSSRSARSTWSTSARATRVPPQFEERNLYVHNPSVTLMRTTAEECAELGRRIAREAVGGDRAGGAVRAAARRLA